MHEIFISYSSKHRLLTAELAAVLEEQYGAGSVWWDTELEARAAYATQIRAALEKSRVVVVIWTDGAMVSDYVYAEAQRALESGKLVNVRPRDTSFRDVPEPFNIHHIDEAEDHARILATVAKVWNGAPIPTRVPLHEIYFRQHGHRLLDPKQKKLPRDLREISPSELLQAKYGTVPYADVTGMAAELVDWCTNTPRPTAGRLLHGPGGMGKTRLLIHVAALLRDEYGWTAGFLDQPHEAVETTLKQRWQALEQLVDHGDDEGLLIVLDYAEGRQDELVRLARRLAERPDANTRPIRLVHLARSAGEWWECLVEEQPEIDRLLRGYPSVSELSIIPEPQQRLAMFDAARQAFTPALTAQGYAAPSDGPSPPHHQRLSDYNGHERPLTVQMEALLSLVANFPTEGTSKIHGLLDRILGLERAHWRRLLKGADEDRIREFARGVSQITLVQGLSSATAAERLLLLDSYFADRTSRAAVDALIRDLVRLYGHQRGIAPLEPDLIGEHLVASVADVELLESCLQWIANEQGEAQCKRRRDIITVLQRATQPEHGPDATSRVGILIDHLIHTDAPAWAEDLVATLISTPGLLIGHLAAGIADIDDTKLVALLRALPKRAVEAVRTAAYTHRHSGISDNQIKATFEFWRNITLVKSDLMFRDEKILSELELLKFFTSSKISKWFRRSAAIHRRRAVLMAELTERLCILSEGLTVLGRYHEAVVTNLHGASAWRMLTPGCGTASLPYAARSLETLAGHLTRLGEDQEALAAQSPTRNDLSYFSHLWLVGVASNDGATRCRGLKSPGASIGVTGRGMQVT